MSYPTRYRQPNDDSPRPIGAVPPAAPVRPTQALPGAPKLTEPTVSIQPFGTPTPALPPNQAPSPAAAPTPAPVTAPFPGYRPPTKRRYYNMDGVQPSAYRAATERLAEQQKLEARLSSGETSRPIGRPWEWSDRAAAPAPAEATLVAPLPWQIEEVVTTQGAAVEKLTEAVRSKLAALTPEQVAANPFYRQAAENPEYAAASLLARTTAALHPQVQPNVMDEEVRQTLARSDTYQWLAWIKEVQGGR